MVDPHREQAHSEGVILDHFNNAISNEINDTITDDMVIACLERNHIELLNVFLAHKQKPFKKPNMLWKIKSRLSEDKQLHRLTQITTKMKQVAGQITADYNRLSELMGHKNASSILMSGDTDKLKI